MASLKTGHVFVIYTALVLRSLPKDKLTVCICEREALFVWFNTEEALHGIGQLPCSASDHDALTHDCFLDLSRVTTFPPFELNTARDRGPISDELRGAIVEIVETGIKTLPGRFAELIIQNLRQGFQ
jgi:hypothetical protein